MNITKKFLNAVEIDYYWFILECTKENQKKYKIDSFQVYLDIVFIYFKMDWRSIEI